MKLRSVNGELLDMNKVTRKMLYGRGFSDVQVAKIYDFAKASKSNVIEVIR